ncbi:MOSC N-terminal beta barrel domain-containing protein [Nocardia sp. NPDC050712]|uniref:MOSC domain-containing protein n=1 Tax=Nocardia sp. NPDC050712 TaxID=3155518 RepID=UPI003402692F
MATVSELWLYPIKGCAGTPLTRAEILPTGVVHDRAFMFVRPDGLFRSQRSTPLLSVIRPELAGDGAKLTLGALDHETHTLDIRSDGPRLTVNVHNTWEGAGVDQGDEVAAWASALLEEDVRLVRVPPEHQRAVDEWHGDITFTDSTALHLTSDASLDDLNARIEANGAAPVPMERFRPNIVVTGWTTPYAEDDIRDFTLGSTELRWVKPDVRCQVTVVDQPTGKRAGPEPLRTLAGYRRDPGGGVTFGIKVAVNRPGTITLGDELVVH